MKPIIDLHVHTISSGHAYSTILENVIAAKEAGLKYVGISDHTSKMPGGAHQYHFDNMIVVPKLIEGVRVFRGAEINIMDEFGTLDLKDTSIKRLDYAIASLHGPCYSHSHTLDQNMSAYKAVCNNPLIDIIGHPDDGRYPIDRDELAKIAKETNTIIEVNCSSIKPASYRLNGLENTKEMIEACKKYGTLIVVNSDAHHAVDVGKLDLGISLLKELDFPKELTLNFNEDLILKLFDK